MNNKNIQQNTTQNLTRVRKQESTTKHYTEFN